MPLVDLSDIEWGDVLSDADGVRCVVKRFAETAVRREIAHYALLRRLGVPTLEVLGAGPDWIALEEIEGSEWRLGNEADLADAAVARALASWYATLHTAGRTAERTGLFRQTDVVTPESLALIGRRWPELAGGVDWALRQLPELNARLDALPETLTLNDFSWTNLAVHAFGGSALMTGYDLLGRGSAYADVRSVLTSLTPDAGAAFLDAYEAVSPLDPTERDLDAELAPLIALALAARLEQRPRWADASYRWLAAQG